MTIPEKEFEKYYHNECGKLILQHKDFRYIAERSYKGVDRVILLRHNVVMKDKKFSELDLNEWLWVLPK